MEGRICPFCQARVHDAKLVGRPHARLRYQCSACGTLSEWHFSDLTLVRGMQACHDALGKRKVLYPSKKVAKKNLVRLHGRKKAMAIYPCVRMCAGEDIEGFHVGH